MKFFAATLVLFFCLIANTFAKLYVTLPDKDSVWVSGSKGLVQWSSSASEFGVDCTIELINVHNENVALVLSANRSVPCSVNVFTTDTLPFFQGEDYMLRIGKKNDSSSWSYTQDFKIYANPAQHKPHY
ncbi:uncharacterized protein B0P05DRAFT_541376 [Gilbertella persicaria]|uniref:uncharacterized protein n=1 Tax=Gilbertella persicaria TaxID=101096 RepID=UPI002220F6DA|nr:uncharacterized protein B0P05DRAFT_541376 [Gilbertella persicaria]KAI8079629.1 hypothetical protein B0P05DRAFT_541376 [Gilbertella persicaria]